MVVIKKGVRCGGEGNDRHGMVDTMMVVLVGND